MWVDGARASSATLVSALAIGLCSVLTQTIDLEYFDQVPGQERGAWTTGERGHDDTE